MIFTTTAIAAISLLYPHFQFFHISRETNHHYRHSRCTLTPTSFIAAVVFTAIAAISLKYFHFQFIHNSRDTYHHYRHSRHTITFTPILFIAVIEFTTLAAEAKYHPVLPRHSSSRFIHTHTRVYFPLPAIIITTTLNYQPWTTALPHWQQKVPRQIHPRL